MAALRRALVPLLALLCLAGADPGPPAPPPRVAFAAPGERPSSRSRCFIVKLRDGTPAAAARELLAGVNRTEAGVWHSALRGFYHCAGALNKTQLLLWANDSRVEYVEEDRKVRPAATQAVSSVLWNLDRIDQRYLPLDGQFTYNYTGAGVYLYVVDTGVRSTHEQLRGRVLPGRNFVSGLAANNTTDCFGHGTHVAGTAAGASVGVARGAAVVPVRVFNCAGEGTLVSVLNALNWIATQPKPGVINLSLYTSATSALDAAVQSLISQGYHVVAAAGDWAQDACNLSPGRVAGAITVGGTTIQDVMMDYSCYGTCVDLFAPGTSIYSAWYTNDTAYMVADGSSMATALTSGVVAAYLEANASTTPAAMQAFMKQVATGGVLNVWSGSPNQLVYSQGVLDSDSLTNLSPDSGPTVGNGSAGNSSGSGSDDGVRNVSVPFNYSEPSLSVGTPEVTLSSALYWTLIVPAFLLCAIFYVVCRLAHRRCGVPDPDKQEAAQASRRPNNRPRPSWGGRPSRSDHSLVYGIPIRISVEHPQGEGEMDVVDGLPEGGFPPDLLPEAILPPPAPAPPAPPVPPAAVAQPQAPTPGGAAAPPGPALPAEAPPPPPPPVEGRPVAPAPPPGLV